MKKIRNPQFAIPINSYIISKPNFNSIACNTKNYI